jgi:hypothetical protein
MTLKPSCLLAGRSLEFSKYNYGSEFQRQSLKRLPGPQFRCFPDRVGLRLTVADLGQNSLFFRVVNIEEVIDMMP